MEGAGHVVTSYEPTLESLNRHRVPAWFEDAKLGIFIHWGLFSIPGFAPRLDHVSEAFTKHYRLSAVMTPYTEWYENAIRVPESPSAEHHDREWQGRPYADFKQDFELGLEQWDPAEWARLFKRAGARYVVLVTKHHDGFCLWPSQVVNPHRSDWTTERDVVGELATAVRAEGLRFGVYYSGGIDWSFNTQPVRTLVQFIGSTPGGDYPAYAEAQVRELIERYEPDILWNDIAWPTPLPKLLKLFADYYAAVPEGVVNDRWMHRGWPMKLISLAPVQRLADYWLEGRIRKQAAQGDYSPGIVPPAPAHYDFRTPEYTSFPEISERKWECTRGMSPSFGYNRADTEEHYEDPDELVCSFIDSVSKNGNLLLNVGPRGEDGAIPEMQRSRLELLGDWLDTDGEAIYGSRPWTTADSETKDGERVRFTQSGETLFTTILGQPRGMEISIPVPGAVSKDWVVVRLADGQEVDAQIEEDRVTIFLKERLPNAPAHSFSFTPASPSG
jgi:alpha-L-fucosidase